MTTEPEQVTDPSLYKLRGGPESLQGISLRMIEPKSLMNLCANRKKTKLLIKDVEAIKKYLTTRIK